MHNNITGKNKNEYKIAKYKDNKERIFYDYCLGKKM